MAVDFRLRLGARADDLTHKVARDDGSPEAVDVEPDPRDVLRAFGRAATREPGEPDYDFLLGCALLRAGQPARAAAHCADAVRLDRSTPSTTSPSGARIGSWAASRRRNGPSASGRAASRGRRGP